MYFLNIFASLAAGLHKERSTNLFHEAFGILTIDFPTSLQIQLGSNQKNANLLMSVLLDFLGPML